MRGEKGAEKEGSSGGKGLGLRHEERSTVIRSRADTGAAGVQSAAPCSRCDVQGLVQLGVDRAEERHSMPRGVGTSVGRLFFAHGIGCCAAHHV